MKIVAMIKYQKPSCAHIDIERYKSKQEAEYELLFKVRKCSQCGCDRVVIKMERDK